MSPGDDARARWWPGGRGRGPGRRRARSWRTAGRRRPARRREVGGAQLGERGVDHRQRRGGCRPRARPWPGRCLMHRRHAAGEQAVGEGAARASPPGSGSARRSGCRWRSVMSGAATSTHRRAVDVDADLAQVVRDQPAEQPGRLARRRASRRRQRADRRARTAAAATAAAAAASPGRPPGRSAPAGGGHGRAPCSSSVSARSCARSAQLRWNRMTPAGGRRQQQLALGRRRAPARRCRRRPRAGGPQLTPAHWPIGPTMKHWPPLPRMAPQALAAASREANGPAWRRYSGP